MRRLIPARGLLRPASVAVAAVVFTAMSVASAVAPPARAAGGCSLLGGKTSNGTTVTVTGSVDCTNTSGVWGGGGGSVPPCWLAPRFTGQAMYDLMNGGDTRAFNLGVGRGFSVQEVIDSAKRVTRREFEVITEGRRPGDPAQLIADPSLANRVFGWKARYVDIDEIVAHNWAWQLKTMSS